MEDNNKLSKQTWDKINEAVEGDVIADPDNYKRDSETEPEEPTLSEQYEKEDLDNETNLSKVQRKMLAVVETNVDFFKADNEKVFASITTAVGVTHHDINSEKYKTYLGGLCVENQINPTDQLLKLLIASSKYTLLNDDEAEFASIYHRKGWENETTLWILRAVEPTVSYIKVTPKGWSIETECPIKITLGSRSASIPEPEKAASGNYNLINQYLNIPENEYPILEAWLMEANLGTMEYPILNLLGETGTGKSTLIDIAHCLVDPKITPEGTIGGSKRGMIKDDWSMYVTATNTHILAMDNISWKKNWFDDVLCQIATGGDYEARTLHTNTETTVLSSHNPIILGAINQVSEATDVLGRSIYVHTQELKGDKRLPKSVFWDSFFNDLPYIYSGYLNHMVAILQNRKKANQKGVARMGDFTVTGRTLELFRAEVWAVSFDKAMEYSNETIIETTLEETPLAQLVIHHFKKIGEEELALFTSEWAIELFSVAEEVSGIVDKDKSYLRSLFTQKEKRQMGKEFRKIKPLLNDLGYGFEVDRKSSRGSRWTISNKEIAKSHATVTTHATPREENSSSDNGMNDKSGMNTQTTLKEQDHSGTGFGKDE